MQHNYKKGARFFPLFALLFFALASLAVQLLWNWIIAPTFSLTSFSYWQAMGLLVLCRILFGHPSFGRHHNRPSFSEQSASQRQKWINMTEEERLQFKNEWKKRCGKQEN